MRLSVAVAVSCLFLTSLSAAELAAAAIKKQTNISPQSLGSALQTLAKDRELQVLYRTEVVGDRHTSGASGELTFDEALTKLLHGSNLTFQYLDDKTVTILPVAEATSTSQAGTSWGRLRIAQTDAPTGTAAPQSSGNSDEAGELTRLTLEEIIVTAQKRDERLQDVPVPVSALRAQALLDSNQLRVQDFYNKIPGVSLMLAGNGGEPVLTIRGITTGGETSNPTVGVLVDDVSYGPSVATGISNPPVADIDPNDLSQVEVLRGPQGTLYGASSIGGLIKFVTIDPSTDALAGRVQVGSTSVRHSDDIGYSVRGSVNVPVRDTLAVRASGFTLRDPGYIDNAETGRKDVNDRDSEGGRLSALWRPSDALSLKLSALFQESQRNGTDDIDTSLGGEPQQEFAPGSGLYRRTTQAYSATLTSRLSQAEIVSLTGFSKDELTDSVDFTTFLGGALSDLALAFYGVDRAVTVVDNNVEKFTQEVRVTLPIGPKVEWLVGAFYTREETVRSTDNQAADSSGALAGTIFGTSYDPSIFEERALFTNFTVSITDRWDIQLGGRYSDNEQEFPVIQYGPLAELLFGSDPFVQSESRSEDTAFTYLVTPRFRISPDLMLYARLASGYRPGGPNVSCGLDGVPCKFQADTTRNYDLGFKGNFLERRLTLDASVFYIDWQDVQISGLRTPNLGLLYTGNVCCAESQGVELSVEARPMAGLALSAWVAYNAAELTKFLPTTGDFFGRPGDRLPYSSRYSGNLSIAQEFPLWGTSSGYVGGSMSYVGERRGNFQATDLRQTFPSYVQLDLHGGLHLDSWTLNAFVTNVTDKRGVLRGGLDAVFVPSYITYIQPRTVGLTLAKRF